MPGTDEGERLVALDDVPALGHPQVRVRVVDVLGRAHLDAADGGGERLDGVEVDHHEVVDPDPGDLLDGLPGAARIAALLAEAVVEHRARRPGDGLPVRRPTLRDGHHEVARDAERRGVAAVLGDVEQQRGVRVPGAALVAVLAAQALPAVGADHQDVQGVGDRFGPLGLVAQLHLDGGDVVVEVLVRVVRAAAAGHQGERGEAAGPLQHPTAPGAPGGQGPAPGGPAAGVRGFGRGLGRGVKSLGGDAPGGVGGVPVGARPSVVDVLLHGCSPPSGRSSARRAKCATDSDTLDEPDDGIVPSVISAMVSGGNSAAECGAGNFRGEPLQDHVLCTEQ